MSFRPLHGQQNLKTKDKLTGCPPLQETTPSYQLTHLEVKNPQDQG